eukprot:Awhi_evm1s6568
MPTFRVVFLDLSLITDGFRPFADRQTSFELNALYVNGLSEEISFSTKTAKDLLFSVHLKQPGGVDEDKCITVIEEITKEFMALTASIK